MTSQNSCVQFQQCIKNKLNQNNQPRDPGLASEMLYDGQMAAADCRNELNLDDTTQVVVPAESSPQSFINLRSANPFIKTKEDFNVNYNNINFREILKWLIIGMLVYLVVSLFFDDNSSASLASTSNISFADIELCDLQEGGRKLLDLSTISEFRFL